MIALILLAVLRLFDGESAAMPAEPTPTPPPIVTTGIATWYDYKPGQAAAGPGLRSLLGKHWRGQTVEVSVPGKDPVVVVLTDWCQCEYRMPTERLIDLHYADFAALASPSRGILNVTIRKVTP